MRSIAPWMMLIVAVSFVGWMVFEVGMDVTGGGAQSATDEIANVDGRKIDLQTFYARVRDAQEQQRLQGLPAATTLEEQRALEDAVLEQLVQEALLDREYRRRGIGVTDEEIRRTLLNAPLPEMLNVPDFQTDGQFDLSKYQQFLRSGLDPAFALALEARYREELPRLKLFERVTEDVYVSDAKLWRMYRDRNDSSTALVAALVPQVVVAEGSVELTEEDVRRHYREHPEDFERPARAFLSYVAISRRADSADSAAALARARDVQEEIVGGADFAAVAARESADSATRDDGGDLGEVERGTFVDAFEEAALALRPGQVSEPVLTPFGYHIIRLESKRGNAFQARHVLIPIEPVGEHLDELDRQADSLDLFAAELDDPTALDSVAAGLGLVVTQAPPLYEGSRVQLGRFLVPDVHLWAFEATAGQTSAVSETSWAYYVFRVDSLLPAGLPELSEIRDEVARAARTARQWEATRAIADAMARAIVEGADLEQAAAPHNVRVQRLGPFTRVNPTPALRDAPEAIGAAFGLPVGTAGGPFETEVALLFVEPVRKYFADSAAFVAQREEMRAAVIQEARQARIQLILAALRQQANVVDRRRELQEAQQRQQQVPLGGPLGF